MAEVMRQGERLDAAAEEENPSSPDAGVPGERRRGPTNRDSPRRYTAVRKEPEGVT